MGSGIVFSVSGLPSEQDLERLWGMMEIKRRGGGGNEENALRESFQKGLDYSLTGLGWEGHAESVKQNEAPPF